MIYFLLAGFIIIIIVLLGMGSERDTMEELEGRRELNFETP